MFLRTLALPLATFAVFTQQAFAQQANQESQWKPATTINKSPSSDNMAAEDNLPTTPLTLKNQDKGLYLTGGLGGNWPQTVNGKEITNLYGESYGFKDFHFSGPSIEAGIGYDFGAVRGELTYVYDRSGLSSYSDQFGEFQYSGGDATKNSVFASAYWDINLKSRFVPYVGAGIGYSGLRVQPSSADGLAFDGYDGNTFGYQAKIGVSYLASRRADIFAEAVYRGTPGFNATTGDIQTHYSNYNSWGFLLGARFRLSR